MSIPIVNYPELLKSDLVKLINEHFDNLSPSTAQDVNLATLKLLDNICISLQQLISKSPTIQAVVN